jgi:hypothetical protein
VPEHPSPVGRQPLEFRCSGGVTRTPCHDARLLLWRRLPQPPTPSGMDISVCTLTPFTSLPPAATSTRHGDWSLLIGDGRQYADAPLWAVDESPPEDRMATDTCPSERYKAALHTLSKTNPRPDYWKALGSSVRQASVSVPTERIIPVWEWLDIWAERQFRDTVTPLRYTVRAVLCVAVMVASLAVAAHAGVAHKDIGVGLLVCCVVALFASWLAMPLEVLVTSSIIGFSVAPGGAFALQLCVLSLRVRTLCAVASAEHREAKAAVAHRPPKTPADRRAYVDGSIGRGLHFLLLRCCIGTMVVTGSILALLAGVFGAQLPDRRFARLHHLDPHYTDIVYSSVASVIALSAVLWFLYGPMQRQAERDGVWSRPEWDNFRKRRDLIVEAVWTLGGVAVAFLPAALDSTWLPFVTLTGAGVLLLTPRVRQWLDARSSREESRRAAARSAHRGDDLQLEPD